MNPTLRAWLQADGSLTARLRCLGHVEVVVLRQGSQSLWRQEQVDLNCHSGHVREVALLVNGIPSVWARSTTSHAALQGPWKALANLGNRPLAELLFQVRHIERDPLQTHYLKRHGMAERQLRDSWAELHGAMSAIQLPRWGRSSVFWRHGQPLRVFEAFAPWVGQLQRH